MTRVFAPVDVVTDHDDGILLGQPRFHEFIQKSLKLRDLPVEISDGESEWVTQLFDEGFARQLQSFEEVHLQVPNELVLFINQDGNRRDCLIR